MCGIVGCVSKNPIQKLIYGLHKLEYRGYDSAGIFVENFKYHNSGTFKSVGTVSELEKKLMGVNLFDEGTGIGHCRWATNGPVNEENCHPHSYMAFHLVHNGIIENAELLREKYCKDDEFKGTTDSEVLVHLIYHFYKEPKSERIQDKVDAVLDALKIALSKVVGAYAIALVYTGTKDTIYCAKHGSPLVIGFGSESDCYVASDKSAIEKFCKKITVLEDDDVIDIGPDGVTFNKDANRIEYDSSDSIEYELGDNEDFMIKEIREQIDYLRLCVSGRLEETNARLGGLNEHRSELKSINRFIILGEGTSYHAGLIGKYLLEDIAEIPVEVDYASEFAYRNPIIEPNTAIIAISQSGETADLLKAVTEAKSRGAFIIGITNGIDSSLTRLTDCGVYMRCGKEMSVASTKSFTASITVLYLISIYIGRMRHLSLDRAKTLIEDLKDTLKSVGIYRLEKITKEQFSVVTPNEKSKIIFVGKNELYPIAMEACLKLTEISYTQCSAYTSGSFKHGPLALIDENAIVYVFHNLRREVLEKKCRNCIEEIEARHGVVQEFSGELTLYRSLIVTSIAAQLIAYYYAKLIKKIENIDKPRNLAKSVTTE